MAAPDWVSYVSLGLASVAVGTSTLGAYRARPNVRLSVLNEKYEPDAALKV